MRNKKTVYGNQYGSQWTCFAGIIKTAMTVYALKVRVKYRGIDYGLWALSTSEMTCSSYSRQGPDRFDLAPLPKNYKSPKSTRRPSTVHTERNDFDINPGNQPGICNYKVEVTASTRPPKKIRTGSLGAHRHSFSNFSKDEETGDRITPLPAALLASSCGANDGIYPPSPTNRIMRTTDVFVSMQQVLDEECPDMDDEEAETKRSKWKC
ncbi:predicted protein [Uncinocarpus reesii 1704]|uniref:Uncharacterized protein n=1 Tax=Uncinocarpus reesii (strain UAMH 1704) TaxID=336963 RepID=C4JN89_UNCRE|nr:uncharacterized protein UREG_04295 [Uncinocarpus reesii 1704]EEP79449.1 predicted protein [Uncinocarpus reesii 1704]